MEKHMKIIIIALLLVCSILSIDNRETFNETKQGQIEMAEGVYWIGADNNMYSKQAGVTGVTKNSPASYNSPNFYMPAGLQQINDPNAPAPAPASSGSGGGGGSATDIAAYDQSINNTQAAINRLGSDFEQGASQVDTSYQNAINQLLLGKNTANKSYDTNKQQTAKDYVGAKNTIGSNAGNSLNGLLRLLGARGAGGSSAARVSAPEAVSRQATLQRGEVGGQFGANNQALDTNWNNYLTDYNNQVSSAGNQRDQQKGELQSAIERNRATLLQTLSQLSGQRAAAAGGSATGAAQPFLDQANDALNRASSYRATPITYNTQAYSAPELSKYLTNPNAAPTYQGQSPTNDYFNPFLSALLGKKQNQTVAA